MITQQEAARLVADDSNKHEFKGSQYTQEGTDEDGKYTQFGGETPGGGMKSWLIQSYKTEKK